jgi:hypothetical protein
MFPLDPAPSTLLSLMARFKNPVRVLIRKVLPARDELAFAFVLARYPMLDLELSAKADVELHQYYPIAKRPASVIVARTRTDQGV